MILCGYSCLYQIAHLGDDDDEPEFSSAMPLEEGDTFFFQPRTLKNLVVVDELESLSPIMHTQVKLDLVLKLFVIQSIHIIHTSWINMKCVNFNLKDQNSSLLISIADGMINQLPVSNVHTGQWNHSCQLKKDDVVSNLQPFDKEQIMLTAL